MINQGRALKRNDLCHEYGIDIITLNCDGVTEALQPTWFKKRCQHPVPH